MIGFTGFFILLQYSGGEGEIRTLDTLLAYTHFPGVLFRPLRHFSVSFNGLQKYKNRALKRYKLSNHKTLPAAIFKLNFTLCLRRMPFGSITDANA